METTLRNLAREYHNYVTSLENKIRTGTGCYSRPQITLTITADRNHSVNFRSKVSYNIWDHVDYADIDS